MHGAISWLARELKIRRLERVGLKEGKQESHLCYSSRNRDKMDTSIFYLHLKCSKSKIHSFYDLDCCTTQDDEHRGRLFRSLTFPLTPALS